MDKGSANGLLDLNYSVIFHNFINALRRMLWLALVLAVVAGGAAYVRSAQSYSPLYSCSVVFSVHASYSATTDIASQSDYLDSNAATILSQTFPYVIRSENARMLLSVELGGKTPGNITAQSTANSGLFTMTVTDADPQNAYDTLLAAIAIYPQAASSILGDTQIDIINKPLAPPTQPVSPNTAGRDGLRMGLIVFVIILAGIFLLSLTRKTVHSAEDLRKLVNLKCLAYVPQIHLKKHSNKTSQLLTLNNPRIGSSFNESIRELRLKLQKNLDSNKSNVVLITSTLPNEGKTTVATNLALSLAQEGKRVILIDGDLRKQSLKDAVGLTEPSDGLADILMGDAKNFRLLNVPGSTLLLLSGDNVIDQPQPLLDTPKMQRLLDMLREKLDFIIIDTPPAYILSDAATLAKYADATLYIVRQDLASTSQILNSIQSLSSSGINLVGCVLNQTQAGTTRYGYSKKYGYGNKYYYGGYRYGKSGYSRYDKENAAKLTQEIHQVANRDDS